MGLCLLLGGCAAGSGWSVLGEKPKVHATGKESGRVEKVEDENAFMYDVLEVVENGFVEEDVSTAPDGESYPAELDVMRAGVGKSEVLAQPQIVHKMDGVFVGKRLRKYAEKKQQWNVLAGEIVSLDKGDSWPVGWYKCVQDVEMLHFGYQRLYAALDESLSNHPVTGKNISPWNVLAKDIAYAESSCDDLQAEAQKGVSQEVGSYASLSLMQPVDLFRQYMVKRQYSEAISTYEKLVSVGGEIPAPEIRQEYGVALRRSERYADAALVLRGVIETEAFAIEDFVLWFAAQREYADLLLVTGEKEMAVKWYETIENHVTHLDEYRDWAQDHLSILSGSEEIFSQYQQVLKAFYRFDGTYLPTELVLELDDTELAEESIQLRSVNRLRAEAEERSLKWFKQQLLTLDELINDQDYAKARTMVTQLRQQASGIMLEQLLMIDEHIAQAEQFDLHNMRQLRQQSNETEWQKAIRALENKEYDTAIRLFSGLLHGENGGEARSYISKASDLAASDLRRRGAGLFAKARRTSDPARKERLLAESRDLLQNLLSSYPDAAIANKARRNLQVIENELQKITPSPELKIESETNGWL